MITQLVEVPVILPQYITDRIQAIVYEYWIETHHHPTFASLWDMVLREWGNMDKPQDAITCVCSPTLTDDVSWYVKEMTIQHLRMQRTLPDFYIQWMWAMESVKHNIKRNENGKEES